MIYLLFIFLLIGCDSTYENYVESKNATEIILKIKISDPIKENIPKIKPIQFKIEDRIRSKFKNYTLVLSDKYSEEQMIKIDECLPLCIDSCMEKEIKEKKCRFKCSFECDPFITTNLKD